MIVADSAPSLQRGPHRIHRHVPAADDDDLFSPDDRRVVFGKAVGLHEIRTGKVLVRRIDAAQVLAGDVHEDRGPCADGDVHRVIPLGEELIHRLEAADDRVGLDLYSQFHEIVDFRIHDRLGETELRDAVDEDASRLVEGLEDRHVVPITDQIPGDGEPRGPRPDDGNAFPVALRPRGDGDLSRIPFVVGGKTLQTADGDRFTLLREDTDLLALVLLRADPPADGGEARLSPSV